MKTISDYLGGLPMRTAKGKRIIDKLVLDRAHVGEYDEAVL